MMEHWCTPVLCASVCVCMCTWVCVHVVHVNTSESEGKRERERESARETEAEREKEINMCESVCKVYTVCVRGHYVCVCVFMSVRVLLLLTWLFHMCVFPYVSFYAFILMRLFSCVCSHVFVRVCLFPVCKVLLQR